MRPFHVVLCLVILGQVHGMAQDVLLWHWGKTRALSADEERDLTAAGVVAIADWTALISLDGSRVILNRRGGTVTGVPGIRRCTVIRVDPACNGLLDSNRAEDVANAILRVERHGGGPPSAVQIDWDVPTRQLPAYAHFLARLRARLPSGVELSCTGLPAWLEAPALADVVAAVDWWVPQAYSNGLPSQPWGCRRLVMTAELERIVAACDRLNRPYRIGLPTYEQTSAWTADGNVSSAALRLSVEDLFATAGSPHVWEGDGERLIGFRPGPGQMLTTAGAATVIVNAMPTVGTLGDQLELLRTHAGSACLGAALFRLSAADELPALTPGQIRAAVERRSVAPAITWSWEGTSDARHLEVTNAGLADFQAIRHPLTVVIAGAWAESIAADRAPGLRWSPALDGCPVAAAHANGVVIQLSFLRAGARLALPTWPVVNPFPQVNQMASPAADSEEDPP